MKTLMETLNETLENSLQLEIARLTDEQAGEEQEETSENNYPNDSHIYPCYENYKVALSEKLFNGTYNEYLKLNIVFGSTAPIGRRIK